MKKFVLAALLAIACASGISAQYSTAITAAVSAAGPFGSVVVNPNEKVQVPLQFVNTTGIGLLVAGALTYPEVVTTAGGNIATSALSQSWNVIVAQFNGVWYEFDRTSGRSPLSLNEYTLTSFTPTQQSTGFTNAEVPITAAANMNVVIQAVTAVAGEKAALASQVSLDPRQADNQTIYLLSSDYSQGISLTVSSNFSYDFEVANGFQNSSSTTNILNAYDLPTIRTSLTYWAVLTGAQNADTDEQNGVVKHLDSALVDYLNDPNNSAIANPLRVQVLSVLASELQVSSLPNSKLQTWGFPTSQLYRSVSQNTPDYSDAFFTILEQKQVLSAPTAVVNQEVNAKLVRSDLASLALGYLTAATTNEPKTTSAFTASLSGTNDNWVPSYNPTSPMTLVLSTQDLQQITPTVGLPASTITLTIPPQSPTPSSPTIPKFQSPLLFFPPGPNLLNAQTLSNYAAIQPLEQPVSTGGSYQGITNSIELDFSSPQNIEALLFWLSQGTSVSSITASLGGIPVTMPSSNGVLNYATALPVPNVASMSQIAIQNALTTPFGLALNDWGQPVQVDKIVISFTGGPVLNLRAYAKKTSFDTTLVYTAASQFIAVTTKATSQPPELFSTTAGNDEPYFLQQSGSLMPRGGSQSLQNYQPIWYAAGGLESPLSFNIKMLNNQFWKTEFGVKSLLPFTEFDLAKAQNQPISVDSRFTYRSGSSASGMPSAPPLPLPAFLPLPLPGNARTWGSFVYPYVYGLVPSSASGAVTDPNSPLYVEKLAGVDGPGMLLSLIKMLGWSTLTNPDVQQRFNSRVGLSTYSQVQSGTPWQSYAASTSYLTQPIWFLENSYVLTDWREALPGDILVGYEGSELTVAIVVSVDANDPDPMHAVSVVTISRATQRALYSRWSSMSLNPNGYHLRRLVIQQPVSDVPPPTSTGFFQFPSTFQLTYNLNRADPDNFKQWIPNTGELAYLGKIQPVVQGVTTTGVLLNGAPWSIPLNSVRSYTVGNPNAPQALSGKNQTTTFYLVALKSPHAEDGMSVLLPQPYNFAPTGGATDNYWVNPSLTNGNYVVVYKFTPASSGPGFTVEPNPNFIGTGWTQTVVDGTLALVDPSHFVYEHFAIVASGDGGPAVPGDDLRIGLQLQSAFGAISVDFSVAPRLAVYDKKMLWRANLYIDEGAGQRDNNGNYKDWNDRHPWPGSPTDPNEWNHDENGNPGNGGQVLTLPPYTWVGNTGGYGGNGQTKVSFDGSGTMPSGKLNGRRVAYDYYGADTPFDFKTKMLYQQAYMAKVYSSVGVATVALPTPTKDQYDLATPLISAWNSTISPPLTSTNVYNYVRVFETPEFVGNSFGAEITTVQRNQVASGDILSHPYIPGYSYYAEHLIAPSLQSANTNSQGKPYAPSAAGLDCTAFVRRAMQASQNLYSTAIHYPAGSIWRNMDGIAMSAWRDGQGPPSQNLFTTKIAGTADSSDALMKELRFAIPGDIFYYADHMGLIFGYSSDPSGWTSGSDAENGLLLIESVFNTLSDGTQFGGAINQRVLNVLTVQGKNWTVGRGNPHE